MPVADAVRVLRVLVEDREQVLRVLLGDRVLRVLLGDRVLRVPVEDGAPVQGADVVLAAGVFDCMFGRRAGLGC